MFNRLPINHLSRHIDQHQVSAREIVMKDMRGSGCEWWLTHWGRNKMADIFQTTFSNAFSWMKMYEFRLRFHWNLFLRFELTIFQHWFRKWLGADQATSHYLNQWWLDLRRIYASLGLNELRIVHLCFEYRWYIHGLAKNCINSIAGALESLQSYTRPSIYLWLSHTVI